MLDLADAQGVRVDNRLRSELMIWLGSTRPDGRPHLAPVWFWWDGKTVLIFSEPETQKIRNLRHSNHVVLALDTADEGEDIVMFAGVAALTAEPSTKLMPDEFGEKYAALFRRLGSTPKAMQARYTQPIRVTPTKRMS
ncbi:MAG: pyridoxamine 5'-phosphate oxidase family protein [Thermomicrobiales bacterium]